MCGICGFTGKDPELIQRMTDVITHRGPDQEGHFVCDEISLGHRRLSIIDLTELGRQPMCNEDGTIQLVYNGEIYNHEELREDLIAKGHVFRSKTDSEVIIHAYEEYGVDCLQLFNGMFAFAIWDFSKKRLFMARDRIGIKPLYYYFKDGHFVFGSEIKSILEDPRVPRSLNNQGLYGYIGFEFIAAPDTLFEGIHKVPAGHYAILQKGDLVVAPYWDLKFDESDAPKSEEEAIEKMRWLFEDAVRCRLMSDVPLGAFLSGGLDSSTIVAMMRKHISGPLRTFTIGYEDKSFSELEYAQIVADKFQTEHHILMIEEMTPELIEKSLWHFDEPMTDLSSIPLMLICQKAKEDITVCLSGEGGDEVFVGYDRFKASFYNNKYFSKIPKPLRKGIIEPMVGMLPDQPQKKGAINMLKRFVEGAALPEEAQHIRWQYFLNAKMEQQLFTDDFKANCSFDPFLRLRESNARCTTSDRINREAYIDTRYQMPDSVLMKVDRMSMAHSLEIRVPLLDHRLVEYMANVPGSWKFDNKGETKACFRKALDGILPHNIAYRGKQGYSLPVKNFLRTQLKDYMTELLHDSPVIRDTINTPYLERLMSEHMSGKANHNHVLWGLMHTAIWHRRFLENGGANA